MNFRSFSFLEKGVWVSKREKLVSFSWLEVEEVSEILVFLLVLYYCVGCTLHDSRRHHSHCSLSE